MQDLDGFCEIGVRKSVQVLGGDILLVLYQGLTTFPPVLFFWKKSASWSGETFFGGLGPSKVLTALARRNAGRLLGFERAYDMLLHQHPGRVREWNGITQEQQQQQQHYTRRTSFSTSFAFCTPVLGNEFPITNQSITFSTTLPTTYGGSCGSGRRKCRRGGTS